MKLFKVFLMLILTVPSFADTRTTRAGIVKPSIGSTSWGPKNNTNFDIIDSSFGILAATQSWTGANTFSTISAVNISSMTVSTMTFVTSATISNLTVTTGTFTSMTVSTMTISSATLSNLRLTTATYINDSSTQTTAYQSQGSVVQVVVSSVTTSSATAVNGSFVNSHLNATIAPKKNTDTIAINVGCEIANSGANVVTLTITRAGTNIGGATNGLAALTTGAGTDQLMNLFSTDFPNTTSSTQYVLQMKGSAGTTTLNDNAGKCTMMLTEIGGP